MCSHPKDFIKNIIVVWVITKLGPSRVAKLDINDKVSSFYDYSHKNLRLELNLSNDGGFTHICVLWIKCSMLVFSISELP